MAQEYKLSYTAKDIDERLGMVPAMAEQLDSAILTIPQELTPEQQAQVRFNLGIDSTLYKATVE